MQKYERYFCYLCLSYDTHIKKCLLYLSRNGEFLKFEADVQLSTEKQLKDWLTSEDTLKIIGVIDEVNT